MRTTARASAAVVAAACATACDRAPNAGESKVVDDVRAIAEAEPVFARIETRGEQVNLAWIGAGGARIAAGRDGSIVTTLDPVVEGGRASQTIVARDETGAPTWTRTVRSHTGGMTIQGIEAVSGTGAAVHIGWTETSVEWDGATIPARGFDVFVVGPQPAIALPGSFVGSVSTLASDGDAVVVAAGSALARSLAPAPLGAPWRLVAAESCAADGDREVIARWRGGAATWLHCVRTSGLANVLALDVAPDGDVVGCFTVGHDDGLRLGTIALEPEPTTEPPADARIVVVRLDGETGTLEWASQLPERGICATVVALASGEVAIANGSLFIGNDRGWRKVPDITTYVVAHGTVPRGVTIVRPSDVAVPAQFVEIDPTDGSTRWRFTLPLGFAPGWPSVAGGTMATVGLFSGRFDAGSSGRLESEATASYTLMLRPDP